VNQKIRDIRVQICENSRNIMKLHFIGIGGIGTSALARYHLAQGNEVSGSDLVSSEITEALEKLGAKIIINSKLKSQNLKVKLKIQNLIKKANLIIYSPAIPKDHPELKLAKKLKIKYQSYPQALGELTKKYFTIAICGSHGKSTVAAMIGLILTKAGLNPTVILGTKLREFGDSNFRMGGPPHIKQRAADSGQFSEHRTSNIEQFNEHQTSNIEQFLVIEADEYKESFLNYWPKIIVLLNIEYDHPDYFKNLRHYILVFKKFVSHLPKDGILIANKDDKNIELLNSKFKSQKSKVKFKIQNYSLKQKETKKLKKILKIPGEFNVSNALAALKVARVLKIPDKISFKVLSQFKGTWRRFDEKTAKIPNTKYPIRIINDYGHHPTQIKVTIEAAKEKYKNKKIWCIFQPHQYQRTYYLFDDFVKVFKSHPVDKVMITDIYTVSGRESKEIMKKVNAQKLVEAINKENVIYLPKEKIIDYLKKNLKGGEVVIIMGAGDIYNLTLKF
jgi:UDP-N-acetylmuramate--alanine ligase